EQRLAVKRFYFGTMVTETDLRILPTLIRFDAIYAILFKCSLRRLIDYRNLWAYARDLYRLKGVAETIDCDQMRRASYLADSRDPHPIIAIAPKIDWFAPHGRAALGPIQFAKRFGPGLLDLPH
ncbi:MAG: glutathione S-transferase C-terminal domain-containing protein, partial [Pseudomonadota bacterium]